MTSTRHACPLCDCEVSWPFRHPRDDGRRVHFCVNCGIGFLPDHDLDIAQIYSEDYYLEALHYGYPEDPPIRIGQSLLWKLFFLHHWAKHIARKHGYTQVIDVGAGLSPGRALSAPDSELIGWEDRDVIPFCARYNEIAYGPCRVRREEARRRLVGLFELVEHVEDPRALLGEVLAESNLPGHLTLYMPLAAADQAQAAGSEWNQLHSSFEHLLFLSPQGIEELLERAAVPGNILVAPPTAILTASPIGAASGSSRRFTDWRAFCTASGIPLHALAPFALMHGLEGAASLYDLTSDCESLRPILDVVSGKQIPPGEEGPAAGVAATNYRRLAREFNWAVKLDNAIELGKLSKPLRLRGQEEASPVRPFTERPLCRSEGGGLNVLYCGMKWDYGRREQGWSYEHQNFYITLYHSRLVDSFVHFDYVDLARTRGHKAMCDELLTTCAQLKPDVVFFVFFEVGMDPDDRTLSLIGEVCDATVVGWFCDDQYRFHDYTRRKAPYLHACVSTLPPSDTRYVDAGLGDRVIHSSWAANPLYYQKSETPSFVHDVALCGLPHSDRRMIVRLLRDSGIDIFTFGAGWGENSRVSFAKLLEVLRTSRINLSPSKTAHGLPGQIKGRNFEVPACGGFLLSGVTDGLEDYFDPVHEMPVYHDNFDLIEKLHLFLSNEELRQEIADRAHARVLKEHTWEHRYRHIFSTIAPRRTVRE